MELFFTSKRAFESEKASPEYEALIKSALLYIDEIYEQDLDNIHTCNKILKIKKNVEIQLSGKLSCFSGLIKTLCFYVSKKLNRKKRRAFWRSFEKTCEEQKVLFHRVQDNEEYDGILFTVQDNEGLLILYKLEGDSNVDND